METDPTLPITPTEKTDSWKSPTSILSIIMAVLTAVSVWASILAYRVSSDAVEVMREQIKASARPYVIADFVEKGKEVYLTMTNLGSSAAHDIKMRVEPYLQYQIDNGMGPVRMQNLPITFLAPGRSLEELIFRKEHRMPFGLVHKVILTYSDSYGTAYTEHMKLGIPGEE